MITISICFRKCFHSFRFCLTRNRLSYLYGLDLWAVYFFQRLSWRNLRRFIRLAEKSRWIYFNAENQVIRVHLRPHKKTYMRINSTLTQGQFLLQPTIHRHNSVDVILIMIFTACLTGRQPLTLVQSCILWLLSASVRCLNIECAILYCLPTFLDSYLSGRCTWLAFCHFNFIRIRWILLQYSNE